MRHPNLTTPFSSNIFPLSGRSYTRNLGRCWRGATEHIVNDGVVRHLLTVERRATEDSTVRKVNTQLYSPVAVPSLSFNVCQRRLDRFLILSGHILELSVIPLVVDSKLFGNYLSFSLYPGVICKIACLNDSKRKQTMPSLFFLNLWFCCLPGWHNNIMLIPPIG